MGIDLHSIEVITEQHNNEVSFWDFWYLKTLKFYLVRHTNLPVILYQKSQSLRFWVKFRNMNETSDILQKHLRYHLR